MIFLTTFAIGLAGLLLLLLLGYAPAALLLPSSLRPWRMMLAPLLGYAAFVVLAQFTTQLGLAMFATAVLAISIAVTLNVALWLRERRAVRADNEDTEAVSTWRIVGLLTLLAFTLGILPLLLYGYNTIIGENWDAEIYMALGEYLKTVPQRDLASVTPNPLLSILLVPPYSLRTHGFSYFHAALSSLLGATSLDTLHPTLALLHALEVPAAYIFLRSIWRWTTRPALFAAALLALNPFLLWITFNTFGMQVPALGLIPAAALVALASLRDAAEGDKLHLWLPGAFGAGLLAAGLAVTYHPALTAWTAICGAGGLALLISYRQRIVRIVSGGVVIVLSAALLSAVAQWLSFSGFLSQYAEQVGGLGLTGFTLPGDALGLSLSFRTLLAAGPSQNLLALVTRGYTLLTLAALLCVIALGLIWAFQELRRRADGWLLRLALIGAGAAYMLIFLWPLRYPYGWFKAQSFVAFLLVSAVVGGCWRLFGGRLDGKDPNPFPTGAGALPRSPDSKQLSAGIQPRNFPPSPAGKGLGVRVFLPLIPSLALLATLALMLWQYRAPIRYDQDTLAVSNVRQWVQPGDPVLLGTGNRPLGMLFNGLAAYALRDADLYGDFNTANAPWDRTRPDSAYSWALLNNSDLPGLYGYTTGDKVWGNDVLALYRRPAGLLYQQNFDKRGDYPTTDPCDPLTLIVGQSQVYLGAAEEQPDGQLQPRRLTLAFATFEAQDLNLTVESTPLGAATAPTSTLVSLTPGLQTFNITVTTQSTITISSTSSSGATPEAFLRWMTLESADNTTVLPETIATQPIPGVIMLSVASALPNVQTTLRVADIPNNPQPITRVVLDIWRRGGNVHPDDHYGFWTFSRTAGTMSFGVVPTLAQPFVVDGAELVPNGQWVSPLKGGNYTASLSIYSGDKLLQTVTDIYTFRLEALSPDSLDMADLIVRRFPILFY